MTCRAVGEKVPCMLGHNALLVHSAASKHVQKEAFTFVCLSVSPHGSLPNTTFGQKISLQYVYSGLFIFCSRIVYI